MQRSLMKLLAHAQCMLLASLSLATGAHAQTGSADGVLVPLRIHVAQRGATADVEIPEHAEVPSRVLLHCEFECVTALPTGRYRLVLRGAESAASEDWMAIRLTRPTAFRSLEPTAKRDIGVALALSGLVLAVPGTIVVAISVSSQMGPGDNPISPAGSIAGLAAVTVGAILAPVGFAMFGKHRRPFRREPFTSPPQQARVVLAPSLGGLAGDVRLQF